MSAKHHMFVVETRQIMANGSSRSGWIAALAALFLLAVAPLAEAYTPDRPGGFAATAGAGEVTLTWSAYNPGPDNGQDWWIAGYQLRYHKGASFPESGGVWRDIAGSGSGTTGHTVTGLENGAGYIFQIRRAYNVYPDWWSWDSYRDYGPASAVATATPQGTPPAMPSGLLATAGDGKVRLAWDDPSDPTITGYELRYTSAASFGAGDAWSAISGSNASTTGHAVTGLANDTEWRFQVRAVNAGGPGPASAEASATPEARYALTFGDVGVLEYSLLFQWTEHNRELPAAKGGSGAVSYAVTPALPKGLAFTSSDRRIRGWGSARATSWTFTTYTLTATDEAGQQATLTFKLRLRYIQPGKPLNLAALSGDRQVTLSWDDPDDPYMSDYELRYRKGGRFGGDGGWTGIAGSSGGATSHVVTGLENGAQYAFQIRAVYRGNGVTNKSRASDAVTATPNAIPEAPTGLAASADNGAMVLGWAPPTNTPDIAKQQLRWKASSALPFTAGDGWTDLPGDATGHRVTGLTNGVAYSFELRAVNGLGAGSAASVAATPHVRLPAAPSGLQATAGAGEMALGWSDPSDPTVTGYELRYTSAASFGANDAWSAIPGSGASATRHRVAGLTEKGLWRFQVRAVNGSGAGPASTVSEELLDLAPGFGAQTVADRSFTVGIPVAAMTLPAATGGDGALAYALTPALPDGLAFDAATREVSGTPTAVTAAATYSYSATDADGDAATLTFTLETPADVAPSFGAAKAPDRTFRQGQPVAAVTLPEAGGGNGPLTYELTPALPDGLTLDVATRRIAGAPSDRTVGASYRWTATDADGDTASLTFVMRVAGGAAPSFGAATAPDHIAYWPFRILIKLPEASGGDGDLTYTLTPGLAPKDHPAGVGNRDLIFDASRREIRTKPIPSLTGYGRGAGAYTYTVTDEDGDEASLTFSITYKLPFPDKPKNLVAAAGDGEVTLTWDAPDPAHNDVKGYIVGYRKGRSMPKTDHLRLIGSKFTHYKDWVLIEGSGRDTTGHTVTGLDNGSDYSFRIRPFRFPEDATAVAPAHQWALKLGWTEVSDSVTAKPNAAPVAPAGLAATGGNGSVMLSWALPPNTSDIGALQLRWKASAALPFTDADAWTDLATDATGHRVAGLANGESYSFELRAANGLGASPAASATGTAEDLAPSFGGAAIADRSFAENRAIAALTLPAAEGGDGLLAYSFSPALPAGLVFDATTREVSGAPTAQQAAATYNYIATDEDGDAASLDFVIAVEEDSSPDFGTATVADLNPVQGSAIQALVLPAASGGNAPVIHTLAPDLPAGLALDPATQTVSGTPTTEQAATSYSWTATDADGQTAVLTFAIAVEADLAPSFGSATVTDRIFTTGEALTALTLPAATGGNGALAYALTPALPAGLAFDPATRTVSGTPTAVAAAATYSYSATDADGDAASLTFAIRVAAPGDIPSFGSQTIPEFDWFVASPGGYSWTLPAATGGNGALSYSLTPDLPGGLTFDNATRELAGAVWNAVPPTAYTYTVEDEDGDRASLTFVITNRVFTYREPENLAAEAGNGRVMLTWNPPSYTDLDHYQIRFTAGSSLGDDDAWSRIPGSDRHTTSHAVTGLANGTAYRFELRAMTRHGAGGTVGVTATPQDRAPSFGDATVADRSFTQDAAITAFTLPEATGGDGALSYALTPVLPAGLALDMATHEVSGTPTAALAATSYSWTATDEDGDSASLSFTIEVLAGAGGSAERDAFGKSLAGLASETLDEAQATIGARLEALPGASSLTMAGRRVEFGAASAPTEFDWRERRTAFDDDRRVSWEELRRDSAFEMSFGEAGMEMTAWGQGGLMRFEAEQAGIDHRSRMETGWLGMDARMGDGLLMGFALSRSAGETEASDGAGFTTALSAAWPYAQLKLASGAEVWTMLGAGNGSVDYRPAEGSGEREALEMRLASAGGRQPLADVGALGLALEADAGFVTLETGGSARSVIGGHEVQVWRARASLEAEHEGWGLGGGSLAPFGSLAWRGDGGDWREGSGVEAGFGARLSAPGSRFTLEAEGRHLALSSEAGYGGAGASLTAGLEPASDGAGLSWSMSLATGVRADGAAMLADDLDYDEAGLGADENRMALELEARYGFRLPAAHGLISPLLRLSEEEGVRRKLEAGLAFEAAKGRVDLELTGGHEARNGADDRRLHLDLRLGF